MSSTDDLRRRTLRARLEHLERTLRTVDAELTTLASAHGLTDFDLEREGVELGRGSFMPRSSTARDHAVLVRAIRV